MTLKKKWYKIYKGKELNFYTGGNPLRKGPASSLPRKAGFSFIKSINKIIMENDIKATVINGANVNGNIGSCTSNVISTPIGRTLWTEDIKYIVTNSCTGEVISYNTWGLTGFSGGLILGSIILIFFFCIAIASTYDSY